MKLGKVDKLFITGTGPEEHAGLTELILMLSDLRSPTLEVFGPAGINGLVVREALKSSRRCALSFLSCHCSRRKGVQCSR